MTLKAKDIHEGTAIAGELVRIKARLGALGLLKTMHALDGATKAIGYELAEKCQEIGLVTDNEKRRRAHLKEQRPEQFAREERRGFRA